MTSQRLTKLIWFVLVFTIVLSGIYLALNLRNTTVNNKLSFLPDEIPSISQIFNSQVILENGVSMADQDKEFSFDKISKYSDKLKSFSVKDTRFIKKSTVSYVVSGNIRNIKEVKDQNGTVVSYEILLDNTKGDKFTETLNIDEIKSSSVFLLTISLKNPSRTEAKISDMKVDDYIILEKSTSLLDNSSQIDVKIELLRSVSGN